jgi:hypothetical protein
MLGMFAKPDLSLPERAALMLTLVQASLMAYVKHGQWPTEDHRATVIGNWLARNGRKAGLMFRGKMSAAGDEMARYLVATLEPGDVPDAGPCPTPQGRGGPGNYIPGTHADARM